MTVIYENTDMTSLTPSLTPHLITSNGQRLCCAALYDYCAELLDTYIQFFE